MLVLSSSQFDPYRKVDRSSAKILDQGSNPEHQKNKEENPPDSHPAHHSERHIIHHVVHLIHHVVHRELASQFGDSSDSTFDRIEGSSADACAAALGERQYGVRSRRAHSGDPRRSVMHGIHATALAVLASFVITSQSFAVEGNAARGQRVFGTCAACHSKYDGRAWIARHGGLTPKMMYLRGRDLAAIVAPCSSSRAASVSRAKRFGGTHQVDDTNTPRASFDGH
jgi:hypothetical protein